MKKQRRRGLTLMELVVVLAILAVVSLVAVVATEGAIDQARFDVTRKTLDNVDTAVLGGTQDGRSVNGFLADMGAPPWELVAKSLSPLTLDPHEGGTPSYRKYDRAALTSPHDDVVLFSGWRGPYLMTPDPSQQVVDGWGNPLLIDDATGKVFSRGGPESPYNSVLFASRILKTDDLKASLFGVLNDEALGTAWTVDAELFLFEPDGRSVGSGATTKTLTVVAGATSPFSFTGLLPGPKALKITQGTRSRVIYFTFPQGGFPMPQTYNFDLQ